MTDLCSPAACLICANQDNPFRVRNPAYPLDVVDKLEEATMPNVDTYMDKKIAAAKNNKCTLENAAIRREWFVYHLYNSFLPFAVLM
jgi:tyrosinase